MSNFLAVLDKRYIHHLALTAGDGADVHAVRRIAEGQYAAHPFAVDGQVNQRTGGGDAVAGTYGVHDGVLGEFCRMRKGEIVTHAQAAGMLLAVHADVGFSNAGKAVACVEHFVPQSAVGGLVRPVAHDDHGVDGAGQYVKGNGGSDVGDETVRFAGAPPAGGMGAEGH